MGLLPRAAWIRCRYDGENRVANRAFCTRLSCDHPRTTCFYARGIATPQCQSRRRRYQWWRTDFATTSISSYAAFILHSVSGALYLFIIDAAGRRCARDVRLSCRSVGSAPNVLDKVGGFRQTPLFVIRYSDCGRESLAVLPSTISRSRASDPLKAWRRSLRIVANQNHRSLSG